MLLTDALIRLKSVNGLSSVATWIWFSFDKRSPSWNDSSRNIIMRPENWPDMYWHGHHFADGVVECNFLIWIYYILIQISPIFLIQVPPPKKKNKQKKTYTTLVPIFAKRGVFFQWEARIREIKKNGSFSIYRHQSAKFWKRVNFGMYLLPIDCSACMNCYASMYLSFNHNLEVMKNTTYIEKCLEFDAVTYILTFTKRVL